MSFTLPANFSYSDPLPFTCNEDPNVKLSILYYLIQASYLVLSAILNVLILNTIFKSKNEEHYRNNSFYILYTTEAVVVSFGSFL